MSQPLGASGNVRALRSVDDLPREPRGSRSELADADSIAGAQPTMTALGAFAGGIAHVFNNLLTAIGFETELAIGRLAADDPARKHLREIEKIGERGAAIARQLLAFSGSQILHAKPVDLSHLVEDLAHELRRLVGGAIEVEMRLEPNLDRVEVDPQQMRQAVLNLASHARDAMPDGGRLTIATENLETETAAGDFPNLGPDPVRGARGGPGRSVVLCMSDNGPGMSEEVRRRVFEPFFDIDSGAEPIGLGLATVYGLITQSGGEITASSDAGEPGGGTTFRIRLPSLERASATGVGTGDQSWETILLVEDEDNVRRPLAEILSGRGYTVLEAASGAQAIDICATHNGPIHLMVTDVLMGAMSGVELADQVAFRRPEMKVLFATGYPAGLADRVSLTSESAPLLKKPFNGRTLVAKVREVLECGD